ncbi:acyl-CoA thioesterase [Sinorhizobium numidicum]|uniref:Acyl-CoA thioesterase n=1 Tax=Sinorhizobium numidicum TaxID=680248 RepID=A0ABY8D1X6_9HYPH|nr:thioesterase family protein [Sinorhizobium numidicum]WEX78231.1 acyl-CoA thioesterase [Sinorhizobium numidicum]WEX84890.1 acyl-CoA thioesterase [Sinorhizobium numidicum]
MDGTHRENVTEIRIPFRDIDMHGHMHNAAYYAHAEAALANLWRHRPAVKGEPAYLVRRSACVYHRGLRFDEPARFTVSVAKVGGSSLSFAVRVEAADQLSAEVEIVWVAVDPVRHRPLPVPAATREWLTAYMA